MRHLLVHLFKLTASLHMQMHSNRSLPARCRAMDAKIAELRAAADLTRTWLHMDMDAFFASVEELEDPSLVRHPHWRSPCPVMYAQKWSTAPVLTHLKIAHLAAHGHECALCLGGRA